MNTEGLTEVAVKDAHPVVEQVTETPPEHEPAAPAVVVEAPLRGRSKNGTGALAFPAWLVVIRQEG